MKRGNQFWRQAGLCAPIAPAFTLVELLVSMTVLTLVILAVAGMINSVSRTTTADRRHLEADNEARRTFDRMAYDFGNMLKRADADTIFASIKGTDAAHGASDKMFFYSDAPAIYDPNPAAVQSATGLIGYRIQNEVTNPSAAPDLQLERLGKGLTWDLPTPTSTPGAVVFLTYPGSTPLAPPTPTPFAGSTFAGVSALTGTSTGPGVWNGTGFWSKTIGSVPPAVPAGAANGYDDGVDTNYHVISNYIFRLEFCFVLKNPTATSQFTTSIAQGQGFGGVSAIVVAVALLDPQGRKQLPGSVSLSSLAAALPDPDFTTNPPGKLMAELWNAKLKSASFSSTLGIPPSVASQIQVYQRYFYLNTP